MPFWTVQDQITPAPPYQNGREVECHNVHFQPPGSFRDGYIFIGMVNDNTAAIKRNDGGVFQTDLKNIRPIPETVEVKLSKNLVQEIKDINNSCSIDHLADVTGRLRKAVIEGVEE